MTLGNEIYIQGYACLMTIGDPRNIRLFNQIFLSKHFVLTTITSPEKKEESGWGDRG